MVDHPDAALVLEGVSHVYDGPRAVDNVNLRVGMGELVGLLGPSGCGKSTLLRLAAGLETLQEGRIWIAGREVARPGASVPPEARGVGLVFQDYALFPHLTVLENVAFGLRHSRAAERRRMAMDMLALVGMDGVAERYPHALSGGEQQRVALARALAPKPALLLLDEPFSGLDIRLRDRVRDETLRVLGEAGISTLIVTHDPEEAMYMADRIAVMRAGRILQEDAPAAIYRAPADGFIARFLGDINCLHATVAGGQAPSPFGCFPADGIADGARVDLLIRPEGLTLADGEAGTVAATVKAVHPLGHSAIVVLRLDGDGRDLRARVGAGRMPATGERVRIGLDRAQTFVFPCTEPGGG